MPSSPDSRCPIVSPERIVADAVAAARANAPSRPIVVGLCGPQGSGKSTIAAALTARVPRSATLSLDDLYLTRVERQALARAVHPLFATRGVPGTHDVALGHAVLDALDRGEPVGLPRFDKAVDDRAPPATWPHLPAGCDLLVFEGWCVGARPQDDAALVRPVNALERIEDADAVWRTAINRALAGAYQSLFGRMDLLVLLEPPSFETVVGWRTEQERALRHARPDAPAGMDDAAVRRFVAHYERLTRHILAEMPARADLTLTLDAERRCVSTRQA